MVEQKDLKKAQIENAIRKGRKSEIPGGFVAIIQKGETFSTKVRDFYAISVSKKFAKSAVTRNQLRRKIRPLVEKYLKEKSEFVAVIVKSPVNDIKTTTNALSQLFGNTIR